MPRLGVSPKGTLAANTGTSGGQAGCGGRFMLFWWHRRRPAGRACDGGGTCETPLRESPLRETPLRESPREFKLC